MIQKVTLKCMLESHIYPALLGVDNATELNQFDKIQFIDI